VSEKGTGEDILLNKQRKAHRERIREYRRIIFSIQAKFLDKKKMLYMSMNGKKLAV